MSVLMNAIRSIKNSLTKRKSLMQKITPFLWFNDNAEEAVNLYVSLFKDSRITDITRYDEQSAAMTGKEPDSVMTIGFELAGQRFAALNGGPRYSFTPTISFAVNCDTQEELDRLWEQLSEEGQEEMCGWLTDRFGVSWQIIPTELPALLQNPDPVKAKNVASALLRMKKLDIAELQRAAL